MNLQLQCYTLTRQKIGPLSINLKALRGRRQRGGCSETQCSPMHRPTRNQTERSQQRNMGLDYRSASLDIHRTLHRELWNIHFPIWSCHCFRTDFLLNPTGFGILYFCFHSFQRIFIISFLTSTMIQCSSKKVLLFGLRLCIYNFEVYSCYRF